MGSAAHSQSLRRDSTNTALLMTAEAVAPRSMTLTLYEEVANRPHFNPDHDAPPRDPPVDRLRGAMRGANAVRFSTPISPLNWSFC